MMRLNIPVLHETEYVDGVEKTVKLVTFNASLFALVRSALDIVCKGTRCALTPFDSHLMSMISHIMSQGVLSAR